MKKYKISKSNLNEFFGFFTKKKTPQQIQKLIDNDPVLQKLQSDMRAINDKGKDYADKLKDRSPEIYKFLQKQGLVPND